MPPPGSEDDLLALLAASQAAFRDGDHRLAAAEARQADGLAGERGNRRLRARARGLLALSMWRQGDPHTALPLALDALADTDALGLPAWSVELRHTVTGILCDLKYLVEALAHATEALGRAQQLSDPVLQSWSFSRLATVYDLLEEKEKAIELYEEASRAAQIAGDMDVLFATYNNQAALLIDDAVDAAEAGESARAEELARRSLALVRASSQFVGSHPIRQMFHLTNQTTPLRLLGDHETMRRNAAQHRILAAQAMPTHRHRTLLLEAEAELTAGQSDRACELLDRLQGCGEEIGPILHLWSMGAAYRAYKAAGRLDRAVQALEVLRLLERNAMRTRLRAHAQALMRDAEVQRAQHDAARSREEAERAARESLQDALTGVANRRALDRHLRRAIDTAAGGVIAVAMIDIDHFKQVNDTHGHEAGDRVLQAVARLLHECTREGDFVARSGGEEFVLVLRVASAQEAAVAGARLLWLIESHDWSAVLSTGGVTVSIGLTQLSPADGSEDVLRRADSALYDAKHGGRNQLRWRWPGA